MAETPANPHVLHSAHVRAYYCNKFHDAHVWDYYYNQFHNAHVWAYYRRRPLDPDHSVFVLHAIGSIKAHHEMLTLLRHCLQRGYQTPAGIRQFAQTLLETYARQLRADYAHWKKQQIGRVSKAGRPAKKAHALDKARALDTLHEAILKQAVIDPELHRSAIASLEQLSAKSGIDRRQVKRSKRGKPPKRSERYHMAIEVWEALKAEEGRTVDSVIRELAERRYDSEHPSDLKSSKDMKVANDRQKKVDALYKKIQAAYYDLKPYFTGEAEPWLGGLIPQEKLFDE